MLEEVTRSLPDLRLEPGHQYEFAPNVSFRGPLATPGQLEPPGLTNAQLRRVDAAIAGEIERT